MKWRWQRFKSPTCRDYRVLVDDGAVLARVTDQQPEPKRRWRLDVITGLNRRTLFFPTLREAKAAALRLARRGEVAR